MVGGGGAAIFLISWYFYKWDFNYQIRCPKKYPTPLRLGIKHMLSMPWRAPSKGGDAPTRGINKGAARKPQRKVALCVCVAGGVRFVAL